MKDGRIEAVAADLAARPGEPVVDIEQRGCLREGHAAHLVLVDPNKPRTVTPGEVLSKCGWSPFEGETFSNSIAGTFVNGQRMWDGGRIDESVRGQRLAFDR